MVLSMSLRTTKSESATPKKRAASEAKTDKTKKAKSAASADDIDPNASHVNSEIVSEWKLPTGVKFLDLFNAKMPGFKGWPVLTDTRISKKQSWNNKAPMCVKYQVSGQCKQGCSLAHVSARDLPDKARSKVNALFKAVYTVS